MIKKFEVRGIHVEVDDNLRKYATKKIGRLDRYISRHLRESVQAEVILRESKAKDKKQCTCEVTIHLPQEVIVVKETTVNMYAAIDIVDSKLKQKIQQYKQTHHDGKNRRRLFARFRKRQPVEVE